MKKTMLLLLLCGSCLFVRAQPQSITIKVETLSKPKGLLPTSPQTRIYQNMIAKSAGGGYLSDTQATTLPFGILATNKPKGELVRYGFHPFFEGIRAAYADHRPFVLSPDMLWLLISQGFATHLQQNAESLRNCFVDHSGKVALMIDDEQLSFDDPNAPWEQVFPKFTEQMRAYLKSDVVDLLTADFSTTTPVERVASQITAMKAMEAYFEYIGVIAICGIPEITLLGTPEDWKKVLDKTRRIGAYELWGWTNELEPILTKIIKTASGKPDVEFWRNIFKQHTSGGCGPDASPYESFYDGWIVKFFPYDAEGKRLDLQRIDWKTKLPDEVVKVDVQGIKRSDKGEEQTIPLEFWAGFIGLEQDSATFALTPQIGWMVRKKDTTNRIQREIFGGRKSEVSIRAKEIPPMILSLDTIDRLEIEFEGRILIPNELASVKIESLLLKGIISKRELERVKSLFPDTYININDRKTYYYQGDKVSEEDYQHKMWSRIFEEWEKDAH